MEHFSSLLSFRCASNSNRGIALGQGGLLGLSVGGGGRSVSFWCPLKRTTGFRGEKGASSPSLDSLSLSSTYPSQLEEGKPSNWFFSGFGVAEDREIERERGGGKNEGQKAILGGYTHAHTQCTALTPTQIRGQRALENRTNDREGAFLREAATGKALSSKRGLRFESEIGRKTKRNREKRKGILAHSSLGHLRENSVDIKSAAY